MNYNITKTKPLRDTTKRDHAVFKAIVSGSTLAEAAAPAGIDPSYARTVALKIALALQRLEHARNPATPKRYDFTMDELRQNQALWLERLRAFQASQNPVTATTGE